MRVGVVQGKRAWCCLCKWEYQETAGDQPPKERLVGHLSLKHNRSLVSLVEKKNLSEFHGVRWQNDLA